MKNKTLEYYENHAEKFFHDTVLADVSDLYEMFLPNIRENGKILDLGCGSGRDSKYFLEQGYVVTALDGSQRLCQLASSYTGLEVVYKDFKEITYKSEYDGIWACASLLHVPEDEIGEVLDRIKEALIPGGILYASFKYGNSEHVKDGRYFNDCNEIKVVELFKYSKGWKEVKCYITKDVRSGREDELWLNVTAIRGNL